MLTATESRQADVISFMTLHNQLRTLVSAVPLHSRSLLFQSENGVTSISNHDHVHKRLLWWLQWWSQPEHIDGAKMFDFRRATVFLFGTPFLKAQND